MNKKDIELKLINFAVNISDWINKLPYHATVSILKDQIIRSSTSSALNYGEAQSAETKRDFVHKINIVLKELRETQINLMMINRIEPFSNDQKINELLKENDQLLAIFFTTLQTARKNMKKSNR